MSTTNNFIRINYGIARGSGKKTEHKNGKLRIRADYDDPSTHRKIMDRIYAKHPGWAVTGYAPATPLADTNRPSAAVPSVGHSSGKNDAKTAEVKFFYAVMKAHNWACIKIGSIPLTNPPDGPSRFIPVFDTREQAIAWCDGDETHIAQMRTC